MSAALVVFIVLWLGLIVALLFFFKGAQGDDNEQ